MTTTDTRPFPRSRVLSLLERRDIKSAQLVCIAEVGSTAHGISVGTDDLDYTVVRMEEFSELVHFNPSRQSMMIRTQPDGVRSRMGDIDLQVYTLRKFATLAAAGNPSILNVLFVQPHVVRRFWEPGKLARLVASRAAGRAYLGYLTQQIERWVGERGQKNVSRPELVEQYGFDTKYAGHAARLAFQGIEYLQTGRITMPMLGVERDIVVGIRTGAYTEAEALAVVRDLESKLEAHYQASRLPDRPNEIGLRSWVTTQYRRYLEDRFDTQ